MFEIKSIKIADIVVSDRIRPVDENQAQVLAVSIKAIGLITPITVRATPNAKAGKYTLVAGAHRLRACIINEAEEIDAIIVKGDQTASKLMEVTENLIRNDLSVIDRAAHVRVLRDLYEEENGEIKRGGDQTAKRQVGVLLEDDRILKFSEYVADRLGISERSYVRLNTISQKLNPQLRERLRQTPLADNQSALLKFAKMEQADQQRMVAALNETHGDSKQALNVVEGKVLTAKTNPQDEYLSKIIDLLAKLDEEHLAKFGTYYEDFVPVSEAAA